MRGCWGRVLIETLWNVNEDLRRTEWKTGTVLIETLWNVNQSNGLSLDWQTIRFNRNIVECKFVYLAQAFCFCLRFNRNIVECKYGHRAGTGTGIFVLIETLWNVNCNSPSIYPSVETVLIETLWNVNQPLPEKKAAACKVLIETLWNVNSKDYIIELSALRFNRNIVECKLIFSACSCAVCAAF